MKCVRLLNIFGFTIISRSRWTENFKEVLNREEPTDPITTEDECESEPNVIIEEIVVTEPTLAEVKAAIKRLKSRKAPGIDSVSAELLKAHTKFSAKKLKCMN